MISGSLIAKFVAWIVRSVRVPWSRLFFAEESEVLLLSLLLPRRQTLTSSGLPSSTSRR